MVNSGRTVTNVTQKERENRIRGHQFITHLKNHKKQECAGHVKIRTPIGTEVEEYFLFANDAVIKIKLQGLKAIDISQKVM